MRAVRLIAPREALQVVDIPSPEPLGTEVLVRVAACGVCHTDLHIVDGSQARVDLPLTLGHEVGRLGGCRRPGRGRAAARGWHGHRRPGARVRRLGLRHLR